ncbi:MAG: TIGR02147 family protein [Fibrobacterota bacterium]
MNNIFEYLDYRIYLREYYEQKKKDKSSFSLRVFGKQADMDASYISKIIKEKRHLGDQYIPKLAKVLGLNDQEQEYFQYLINFNKAPTEKQKQGYFERLLSLRRPHTTRLTEDQYEFYHKWYYSALRNLLEFYPFYEGDSFADLGRELSPPISAEETRKGIELLTNLSLIKRDESQRYCLTENAISTGDTWSSLAIANFQEETILLSSKSLQRHDKCERDISSVTMNITRKEFSIIQNMLRRFRASVINYVNQVEKPTRVYQLNLQLIPLSQKESTSYKDSSHDN